MKLFSYSSSVGLELPRIWTPSGTTSFLDQIRTELTAAARQVRDARTLAGNDIVSKTELANFIDFYNEVTRWLASKPSTYWGANVDRGIDYQKRIEGWRNYLSRKGVTPAGPDVALPGKHEVKILPELDTSTKVIIGVGVGAIAVFALTALIGKWKSDAPSSQP